MCLLKSFELTVLIATSSLLKKATDCVPLGSPDVANLPAGEVYFVPTSAQGSFPFSFCDGTLAEMIVEKGAIREAKLISGDIKLIDARNQQLLDDPATGIIGELGFGTQLLPVSGRDIQDEKILGTCHIATGRSDHLGGNLTPNLFSSRQNATHDDILYAPFKTPDINVTAIIHKNKNSNIILKTSIQLNFLLNSLVLIIQSKLYRMRSINFFVVPLVC